MADRDAVDGIGLALSGGGFRATLFHVGALRRLVELGVLTRIERISSISGGAIIAGRLAQVWGALAANPTVANYDRLVAEPLRAFCRLDIDVAAAGEGMLSLFSSAADVVERQYREHLFDADLSALPDSPVFVFNATNMATGRAFRFTKKYLADYRLGLLRNPQVPVAKAVAASSAFPPFFSPVVLDKPGRFEMAEGADLNADTDYTGRLHLADGGVYDNMGLETVWKRCATVLVSDAGAPFATSAKFDKDWVRQSMRALDIATDQARALRKRMLIADFEAKARAGTYWGIDTDIADYRQDGALRCDPALVLPLAAIRTRLNHFDATEQGRLINWGYALADAAMRRYAPEVVMTTLPPAWPCPEQALG